MGPGPSDVPLRVLQALAAPTIGHLDPEYLQIMDDVRSLLRQVFQTNNEMTIAISGTGSAGMEACVCNLIEPGDTMIVCISGVFGARMADVAGRYGANVVKVEVPWGESIRPEQVLAACKSTPKVKAIGIVQAETSTGLHQPLDEIAEIAHAHGALLVVDAVTSLGGMEVPIDRLGNRRVLLRFTKEPLLSSWSRAGYFRPSSSGGDGSTQDESCQLVFGPFDDSKLLGSDRAYHHTAPINMTYALREACQIVVEEGLENRWERHQKMHRMLRAGLESLGLTYIPEPSLPNLNCIRIPEGIDDASCRKRLLTEFGIEIGAGLGPSRARHGASD